MKNNKKSDLEEELKKFEEQLHKLQQEHPDQDFSQIENIIDHLQKHLTNMDKKGYVWKMILKSILYFGLLYLIYTVCVGSALGFAYSSLQVPNPLQLFYIVPIVALVLMVTQKVLALIMDNVVRNHPVRNYILANVSLIILTTMLDFAYFHIFTNIFICMFVLTGVLILVLIGEYYLTKRFIYW